MAEDARGSTPLMYAPILTWGKWAEHLNTAKDIYWPANQNMQGLREKQIREINLTVKLMWKLPKTLQMEAWTWRNIYGKLEK